MSLIIPSNWTILFWNTTRENAQESCDVKVQPRWLHSDPENCQKPLPKCENEPSVGKIRYLWHWRFMQVQLKSLHNVSEIFSMKTNHVFGYTRLVTPRKRRIPGIFKEFEVKDTTALSCRNFHWTNNYFSFTSLLNTQIILKRRYNSQISPPPRPIFLPSWYMHNRSDVLMDKYYWNVQELRSNCH